MAEQDNSKRQKFMEAAITNPAHPVYKVGWVRSPVLQHYALNVMQLEYMTPEKWFETARPDWLEQLDKVIELCEAEVKKENEAADELSQLKAEVAALKAKLNEPEPEEPKEDQPEAEPEAAPAEA